MSSIDNRVVRMEFDNKRFEAGVSTTMTTLSKLKEALDFKRLNFDSLAKGVGTTVTALSMLKTVLGYGKTFNELQSSANAVNFNPLGDQVLMVQQRFSLLGEFARNVFDRISNKVIDTGETVARALTIEPITTGFDEYQLKMDSVKTILASTGESLETVNGYLEELNLYADKTIYSFSDMTQNIGKFTNAGVSLDSAVAAIKGVSNEAAVSGANANEASRAMYNFAQALSAGSVKLIDWKSIENANMATVEFKEQLIDTAIAMGTLVKEGDEYISTTTDMQGKVSDAFTTTKGFNESLSHQWMTTDVLVQTLSNYSKDVRDMTEAEKAEYEATLMSIYGDEEKVKAIEALGIKAADAATEVTTLKQLMDTVKEGLGSGWTQSMEYVFGDFNEAKALWTGVLREIESVINPIADARNEMLKFWHDAGDQGGRLTAINAVANAWHGVKSVLDTIGTAFDEVFSPITGETLVKITNSFADMATKFKDFTTSAHTVFVIRSFFLAFFNVIKMGAGAMKSLFEVAQPVLDVFETFADGLIDAGLEVAGFINQMSDAANPFKYFLDALRGTDEQMSILVPTIGNVVLAFENLIKGLLGLIGIDIDSYPLFDFFNVIVDFATRALKFPSLETLDGALKSVTDTLSGIANGAFDTVYSIFDGLGHAADSIKSGGIKDALSGLLEFLSPVGEFIGELASTVTEQIPKIVAYLSELDVNQIIDVLLGLMQGGLIYAIIGFVNTMSSIPDELIKKGLPPWGEFIKKLDEKLSDVWKVFDTNFATITVAINSFTTSMNASALLKTAAGVTLLALSLSVLSDIELGKLAKGIVAIAVSMGILVAGLDAMDDSVQAARGIGQLSSAAIKIAVAVAILSGALKSLAGLNTEQVATGLIGIAGAMAVMVTGVVNLAKYGGKMTSSAIGLAVLAVAIRLLVRPVKEFAAMGEELAGGLTGVGILLGELLLFTKFFEGDVLSGKALKTVAVGMIAMAVAIKILETSVKNFATKYSDKQLARGLEGVLALVLGIAAFTEFVDSNAFSISAVLGLLAIAGVMKTLEGVVMSLSTVDSQVLGDTVMTIGIFLVAMAGTLKILTEKAGSMLLGAASMLILANTLSILGNAISVVAKLGDSGGNGAIYLISSLIGVAGALAFLSDKALPAIAAAVAINIVAAAFGQLVPVLKQLGGMEVTQIVVGIGAVIGVMAALAVGAKILSYAAVPLLIIAGTLTALGVAAGAIGAGLMMGAAGIASFATSLAASSVAIVASAGSIATAAGLIGLSIGAGIVGIIAGVFNGTAEIVAAFGTAIHTIGDFILTQGPYVFGIVGHLILNLSGVILSYIPHGIAVISAFVISLMQAIVTWIPPLADTLITGAIVLANSLANGIRNNAPLIYAAVRNVLSAVIELILTGVSELVRLIPGIGPMLADKIDGLKDIVREHLAPESFEEIGDGAMSGMASSFRNGGKELTDVAFDAAQEARDSMAQPLSDGEAIASTFTNDMLSTFMGSVGDFGNVGDMDVNALLESFQNTGVLEAAGVDLSNAGLEGLLSNVSGYGDAGSVNLDTWLNTFLNTDEASSAGGMLATVAADSAAEQSRSFEDAAISDSNAYTSALGQDNTSANAGVDISKKAADAAGQQNQSWNTAAKSSANAYGSSLGSTSVSSQGASLARSGISGASSLWGEYASTGSYLSSGLGSGMLWDSAVSLVKQNARSVAQTALDTMRTTINSASPSKETMKYGRWFTEGFGIGIEKLAWFAARASANVGQKTVDALYASVEAIKDYSQMDYDIDPTIRPVLDITDIQNGVSRANSLIDGINHDVRLSLGEANYARGVFSGVGYSARAPIQELAKALADHDAQNLSNTMTSASMDGSRIDKLEINVYGVASPDEVADAVSRKVKLLGLV